MGNGASGTSMLRLGLSKQATPVTHENSDKVASRLVANKEWDTIIGLLKENPEAARRTEKTTARLPLHVAMMKGASLELTQLLLQLHPEGAFHKDTSMMIPLHYAMLNRCPLETVKALLQADLDSPKEFEKNGYLPLHLACKNGLPYEVVDLLLKAYPDSVSRRSKVGELPLILACEAKAPLTVLEALLESYPYGAFEKFRGRLPLHVACDAALPLSALQVLHRANPAAATDEGGAHFTLPLSLYVGSGRPQLEAMHFLHACNESALGSCDDSKRYPIHYALESGAPAEVVAFILDNEPLTATKFGRGNSTTLEIAIDKRVPDELLLRILSLHPAAAGISDVFLMTPLRRCIKNKLSDRVTLAVLAAHPTAAAELDEYDRVPLHYAASRRSPVEVVKALLEACPDGAKITDCNGQLPLHLCVKRAGPLHNLVPILAAFPEGTNVIDNYGLAPLHHAICETDVGNDIVTEIFKTNKESAAFRVDGKLPLLMALDNRRDLDIVKTVLRANRAAAKETDERFGRLPLQVALKRRLPLEYLRTLLELYSLEEGAATHADWEGSITVHYAIKYRADLCFVIECLRAHPAIVFARDLPIYFPSTARLPDCDEEEFDFLAKDALEVQDVKKIRGKQLLHYAVEELQAPAAVVTEILEFTMPFSREGEYNGAHNFCWTYVLAETNDKYEETIDEMLNRYDGNIEVVRMLADVPNEEGVRASDCATDLCKRQLLRRLFFYNRYIWDDCPPIHVSTSNLVRLATDKDDSNKRVVMKFTQSLELFTKEVEAHQQSNFDNSYVLALLRGHNGDQDSVFLREVTRVGYGPYRYCLVLAFAECDLLYMTQHGGFFGRQRDLACIRGHAAEILRALEHVHGKGLVHCDLTPHNVLREKGYNRERARLKLSNFGASCNYLYKHVAGRGKASPAFLPPEMTPHVHASKIRKEAQRAGERVGDGAGSGSDSGSDSGSGSDAGSVASRGSSISRASGSDSNSTKRAGAEKSATAGPRVRPYKLSSITGQIIDEGSDIITAGVARVTPVVATPAIDVWSFGVLLYYMVVGETLLMASGDDELDLEQRRLLAMWTDDCRLQKLSKVRDSYAYNLIGQCLQKDPRRRPQAAKMLQHPFITQAPPLRYPGMPAKFDVCLVYRRKRLKKVIKSKKASRASAVDYDSDEEVQEGVMRVRLRQKVSDDDRHADRLRQMLVDELKLTVRDCYNDVTGAMEVGNCSNMVQSKCVIVLLSRHAINYKENSFEYLQEDSEYDHMFFQQRVALELRRFGLLEGGIHVLAIGDRMQGQDALDHINKQTAVKEEAVGFMKRSAKRDDDIASAAEKAAAAAAIDSAAEKIKADLLKIEVPPVLDDLVLYGNYYEKYIDEALGKHGGCHPIYVRPEAVGVVEANLVNFLDRACLGAPHEESATALRVLTDIVDCPTFLVAGNASLAWPEALNWFAVQIGVRWSGPAADACLRKRDRGAPMTQQQGNAAKAKIQRMMQLEKQHISEDFETNVATIRLLLEKLELKDAEIGAIKSEMASAEERAERASAQLEKEARRKTTLVGSTKQGGVRRKAAATK